MKIDISVWNNIERLRNANSNLAKTLCSFTALNVFILVYYKQWFGVVVNCLGFITGILTVISKSRFDKLPPQ